MKAIYLVREVPHDATSVLIETTKDKWHQIVEANKDLPTIERRHFIADIIVEGNVYDCVVMEVEYDEYKKWHSEKAKSDRNRKLKQNYQHISLSSEVLEEIESTDSSIIAKDEAITIIELENALAKWTTWALPVYKLYALGKKDEVVEYLMVNHGVSKATAYRYIQSFKDFVKKFLGV